MLKRIRVFIISALILCMSSTVLAESGVNLEVIKADGVSVVVLTPEETMLRADNLAMNVVSGAQSADFVLPEYLTLIEESAFEGIAAERVEISANVVSIGSYAFADCKTLREIFIPATVLKIDDLALDGCENVIIYGTKGTEAERFAIAAGFTFVDPNAETEASDSPSGHAEDPVELPLVTR